MDADGRIIPIVDDCTDDQGEGFKDPIDDLVELYKDNQTGQRRFFNDQYKKFRKQTRQDKGHTHKGVALGVIVALVDHGRLGIADAEKDLKGKRLRSTFLDKQYLRHRRKGIKNL